MKAHSTERSVPRKRSLLVSFIFLLALLTAANIIVYLKRNKVDTFVPATYKEIYHPTDVPTLSGTKIIRQGVLKLETRMREPAGGWIISDDTGDRYEQTGKYPALKLKDFIHNYELETRGLTPPAHISVRFGFYSKEFYKKAGRTQPDNYWLISASIPVGKFRQRPLSYWIDTFPYVDDMEVDPSANKSYVWNLENRLLNSADILHVALNGSFGAWVILLAGCVMLLVSGSGRAPGKAS